MNRLAFGRFVLDFEARELRRDGSPVALSPKAFQLLELLVESRPTALSKAILLDRIWPDTFVVEKNLVNLIAEIRDALGDDHRTQHVIRTVQRFGYAFRGEAGDVPSAIERGGPAHYVLLWPGGRASLREVAPTSRPRPGPRHFSRSARRVETPCGHHDYRGPSRDPGRPAEQERHVRGGSARPPRDAAG